MKHRRYFLVTLVGMTIFWSMSAFMYAFQNGLADWIWFSRMVVATICFIGAGLLTSKE